MPKQQTLARFHDGSQLDFYKCAFLFEKIEKEEKKFPANPEKGRTANKIRSLKRSVIAQDYSTFNENVTLMDAETFSKEKNLRIRIWKQKSYKSPVHLEYESKISDDEIEAFRNFDLFSRTFDKYKNPDFTGKVVIFTIIYICVGSQFYWFELFSK